VNHLNCIYDFTFDFFFLLLIFFSFLSSPSPFSADLLIPMIGNKLGFVGANLFVLWWKKGKKERERSENLVQSLFFGRFFDLTSRENSLLLLQIWRAA
jgi:hypothetical protein